MQLQILDDRTDLTWAEKLAYLTVEFSKLEQHETPVTHLFEGDDYIREMKIPADTLFIGRPHLNGHQVQLVSGSVIALAPNAQTPLEAPLEFKSSPGYQAVFYAVTDVVGRTIHSNPEHLTDVQVLEDRDFEPLALMLARGKEVSMKLLEHAS